MKMINKLLAVGLLSVSFTAFAQSNNDMTQEQSQHDNMTHDDSMKHDDKSPSQY